MIEAERLGKEFHDSKRGLVRAVALGLHLEREADLACVAGYLHDVGNMLTREAHAQTGAILVYQALKHRAAGNDLAAIMAAVANHEEDQGYAVSPIVAQKWAAAVPELRNQSGFAATFMPGGRAPHVGELMRLPDHARI